MSLAVWVTIAILIFANGLFVVAEFGAVSARRSRVRRLCADGSLLARQLLPFIETPVALDRYVSASQIGITLSSLTLGAYAQATLGVWLTALLVERLHLDLLAARSTALVVILLLLTGAQIVFGELVPKALALQYPTEAALFTVLPMRWALIVFRPFIALLNGTATLILRLFGARASAHRHIHSPDEIDLLIAESRDGGLLEPDEHRRLHRALHLGLRSARDLMIPIGRLTLLPLDTPWNEVVRTVASSPFSRIPIHRGSPKQVVGTLRVQDLVHRYVAEGPLPLARLIRPVVRLEEDLPADRIISRLRERRAHQAVVVDKSGEAIGLVTIQDVLGELLGTGR